MAQGPDEKAKKLKQLRERRTQLAKQSIYTGMHGDAKERQASRDANRKAQQDTNKELSVVDPEPPSGIDNLKSGAAKLRTGSEVLKARMRALKAAKKEANQ